MAVHDHVLDSPSSKLVDGLNRIPEPMNDVSPCMVEVSKGQEALSIQTHNLASANNNAKALLSSLPEQLTAMMKPLHTMLAGPHFNNSFHIWKGSTILGGFALHWLNH
jgi:hypothetical protein